MKRLLFYCLIFIFLLALVPFLNPVVAGCDNAYDLILGKYSSDTYGEDFWLCKGVYNLAEDQDDQCIDFEIGCNEIQTSQQCVDKIYNQIVEEKFEETTVLDWPYDGTFGSCISNILISDPWVREGRRTKLRRFILSSQQEYIGIGAEVTEFENILNCGFANGDAGENKCCTNTVVDLDKSLFDTGNIDDENRCVGGLTWFGDAESDTGKCILDETVLTNPIKKLLLTEIEKRTGTANQALLNNPIPQCVIGEAVGEGDNCMCFPSSGAKICEDLNPAIVPDKELDDYRRITKYRSLGIPCNQWVRDEECARESELEKDPEVIKYRQYYDPCAKCMGNNDDSTTEKSIYTALGCIPASPKGVIDTVFQYGIGLAGLVALGCIIYAAFLMQTSAGDPERVKQAQELMTSCITGLIMIILSVFILEVIGVHILRIPGFSSE